MSDVQNGEDSKVSGLLPTICQVCALAYTTANQDPGTVCSVQYLTLKIWELRVLMN